MESNGDMRAHRAFGCFAGVRTHAAWYVQRQHKAAAVQHCGRTLSRRTQSAVKARAVYCVHQRVRPGDEHLVPQRQAVQRLYMHAPVLRGFPIGGGVRCGRLALGQNGYHLHTGVLQAARRHKPVAAVVAPAAEHRRGFQARHAGHQLPGGSCARVFHHAQVREPGRVGQALQFSHLGSRNFVHCILLACGPGARRFYQ